MYCVHSGLYSHKKIFHYSAYLQKESDECKMLSDVSIVSKVHEEEYCRRQEVDHVLHLSAYL